MNSPTRLSASARRLRTIETVLALAAERNPEDITTAAIAERMGVTHGALFRHFETREAVFVAAIEWVASELLARVDAGASGAAPLPALRAVYRAHIDFIVEHPGVPRLILAELQRQGDGEGRLRVAAMLAGYRQRLLALLAQVPAAASIDHDSAATLFLGMVQGLVISALVARDIGRIRAQADALYRVYERALGVSP
jgi:AcrR family transcriptional regulator